MHTSTIVLMIIFTFLIIPLILAEFARAKALPTMEDFFLQSRAMPGILVFFTVYSTWISVFAFLGASAFFYSKGPVYMTTLAWDALFGLLFMVIGKRVWFYGKRYGYLSPAEMFDDIYGYTPLSSTVTLVLFSFTIPYLQIQLSGGAYLIEIASGGLLPWKVSGLMFYMIIIIYLWAGGLRAVALADMFYGFLVFLSMFGIGIMLIGKSGGLSGTVAEIFETGREYFVMPGPEGNAGPMLWLSLFIIVPIGAIMGPQLWLRFFAVGKKRVFNIMPLLLCIVSIQCLGSLLAGLAGIVLVPDVAETDKIIPLMLLKYCPHILAAIFFCCIASAALSTANSQIHAVAAIYTIDFHKKYINKTASEQKLVGIGKWAVLFISAAAYLMLLNQPLLIIDTGTLALGGTAQIFPITLGTLFWKRSNPVAGTAGILTGVCILLAMSFLTSLPVSFCACVGLAANGFIFFVGSLIFETRTIVSAKLAKCHMDYIKHY